MKLKLIKITIASACICAILTGCTTFGVDNDTWSQLTPKQREIAMKNYYRSQSQQEAEQAKIDQINAQNAPLNNAISAVSSLANNAAPHKECMTDDYDNTVCGYNCHKDDYDNVHCDKS